MEGEKKLKFRIEGFYAENQLNILLRILRGRICWSEDTRKILIQPFKAELSKSENFIDPRWYLFPIFFFSFPLFSWLYCLVLLVLKIISFLCQRISSFVLFWLRLDESFCLIRPLVMFVSRKREKGRLTWDRQSKAEIAIDRIYYDSVGRVQPQTSSLPICARLRLINPSSRRQFCSKGRFTD